ncbi:MAG: hypothetical protein HC927_03640 [Deltaproteobacteria bacterium]|nr:hypothetical protein [Deltaproteobacteria bacterium]
MTQPKTLHQGIIELLRRDKRLAIDLARAAAGLPPLPKSYRIQEQTNNAELRKLLSRDEVRQLYPDLILTVHDRRGRLREVWIIEVQLDRDDDKEFIFPTYVAAVQLYFKHYTRLVGISPRGATRRWLFSLGLGPICADTATAGLQFVTRVCNPDALWLLDRAAPPPPESPEALERELQIARRRRMQRC